jgi:hypothetical protein
MASPGTATSTRSCPGNCAVALEPRQHLRQVEGPARGVFGLEGLDTHRGAQPLAIKASQPGFQWLQGVAASTIPIGDAIIVLRSNGPKATVYGVTARRP